MTVWDPRYFKPAKTYVKCVHKYHHSSGPHACDFENHPECPYWDSIRVISDEDMQKAVTLYIKSSIFDENANKLRDSWLHFRLNQYPDVENYGYWYTIAHDEVTKYVNKNRKNSSDT